MVCFRHEAYRPVTDRWLLPIRFEKYLELLDWTAGCFFMGGGNADGASRRRDEAKVISRAGDLPRGLRLTSVLSWRCSYRNL
jgi:hypothetical protein